MNHRSANKLQLQSQPNHRRSTVSPLVKSFGRQSNSASKVLSSLLISLYLHKSNFQSVVKRLAQSFTPKSVPKLCVYRLFADEPLSVS
jgi:hypothetical protein